MALRAVPDHPKFAHLKSLLTTTEQKCSKSHALGYLEAMWHFTGKYTPQGNIGKYTDGQIESWLEWEGEPGKLVDAFIKSGWMDLDEVYRLIVHDWDQHADRATRMALKRSNQEFCVAGAEVVRTPCTHRENTVRNSGNTVDTPLPEVRTCSSLPVPVPVPVPEPEPDSCTKAKQVRSVPDEELAGTLPLNNGTDYRISKAQVLEWKHLYPAVDVMQACRSMKGWLLANPTKRKTSRGVLKFANNWLAKEQDKGGTNGSTNSNGTRYESKYDRAEREARELLGVGDAAGT